MKMLTLSVMFIGGIGDLVAGVLLAKLHARRLTSGRRNLMNPACDVGAALERCSKTASIFGCTRSCRKELHGEARSIRARHRARSAASGHEP